MDVPGVVERDLGNASPRRADDPEVGEEIAFAAESAGELPRASAPQQTLPGKKRVPEIPAHDPPAAVYDGCFVKFTFGACRASGGASKKG